VVNFDCRLQVNVFVGFILLEIDDTLSINTYLDDNLLSINKYTMRLLHEEKSK